MKNTHRTDGSFKNICILGAHALISSFYLSALANVPITYNVVYLSLVLIALIALPISNCVYQFTLSLWLYQICKSAFIFLVCLIIWIVFIVLKWNLLVYIVFLLWFVGLFIMLTPKKLPATGTKVHVSDHIAIEGIKFIVSAITYIILFTSVSVIF